MLLLGTVVPEGLMFYYRYFIFLPAQRYASAGNSHSNVTVHPSICPSVCLSRAGIVAPFDNYGVDLSATDR